MTDVVREMAEALGALCAEVRKVDIDHFPLGNEAYSRAMRLVNQWESGRYVKSRADWVRDTLPGGFQCCGRMAAESPCRSFDQSCLPMNRWRHKKRGTTYAVVGAAVLQMEGKHDGRRMIVYRCCDEDGPLWVRPEDEFIDGRFEPIDPVFNPPGSARNPLRTSDTEEVATLRAQIAALERQIAAYEEQAAGEAP